MIASHCYDNMLMPQIIPCPQALGPSFFYLILSSYLTLLMMFEIVLIIDGIQGFLDLMSRDFLHPS